MFNGRIQQHPHAVSFERRLNESCGIGVFATKQKTDSYMGS